MNRNNRSALWPLEFTMTMGCFASYCMGISFGGYGDFNNGMGFLFASLVSAITSLFVRYLP